MSDNQRTILLGGKEGGMCSSVIRDNPFGSIEFGYDDVVYLFAVCLCHDCAWEISSVPKMLPSRFDAITSEEELFEFA